MCIQPLSKKKVISETKDKSIITQLKVKVKQKKKSPDRREVRACPFQTQNGETSGSRQTTPTLHPLDPDEEGPKLRFKRI